MKIENLKYVNKFKKKFPNYQNFISDKEEAMSAVMKFIKAYPKRKHCTTEFLIAALGNDIEIELQKDGVISVGESQPLFAINDLYPECFDVYIDGSAIIGFDKYDCSEPCTFLKIKTWTDMKKACANWDDVPFYSGNDT